MTSAVPVAPENSSALNESRGEALHLSALLVTAFLLRLAVFYGLPHLIYFDEVFQVTEPAHKLLFGTGITTWEFQAGIRSWFFPGIATGLLWLGSFVGTSPGLINLPMTLAMTALSLAPVYCGFQWGRRLFGVAGGIIVGTVNACWVDLVNFGPHTLNEVAAADTLILALYFGIAMGPKHEARPVAAGLLAGLTFILRVHLAPALLLACLWGSGFRPNRFFWRYACAALVPVAAGGLLDWATWGYPFQSIWWNFWINVVGDVSLDYGAQPPNFLFELLPYYWGTFSLVLVGGAMVGARKMPVLLLVAATVFLTHSIFAHKEFRFIYPAIPLLTTLAGFATAQCVRHIQTLRHGFSTPGIITILALMFWAVSSLIVAQSFAYNRIWSSNGAELASFEDLSRWPDLCGVGVGPMTGMKNAGNSDLPPRVTIYQAVNLQSKAETSAFNAIMTDSVQDYSAFGFAKAACFDGDLDPGGRALTTLCVWKRPGTCSGSGAPYEAPIPHYFLNSAGAVDRDRLHEFRR